MSIFHEDLEKVSLNWRKITDPSQRLLGGSRVSVYGRVFAESENISVGKTRLEATKSEALKLRSSIIFADINCMVINKPPGVSS